jgi:hypothetical protein
MRFLDLLLKDPAIPDLLKSDFDGIPVISCDDVSKYFYQETDQEYWDLKDFPTLAPPLQTFWLDFNAPDAIVSKVTGNEPWKKTAPSHWGFLCFGMDLLREEDRQEFLSRTHKSKRAYFSDIIPQARWGLDMYLHWRQMGVNSSPLWYWSLLLDKDGHVLVDHLTKQNGICTMSLAPNISAYLRDQVEQGADLEAIQIEMMNHIIPYWHTALLAISFLHCHNIQLVDHASEVIPVHNKSQRKRGVQPYQTVPYKVLDIWPMKKVLRTEGQSEKNGTKKALHICRGYFRDYGDGPGLFGNPKLRGKYWMPMTTRGSSQQGVATKDYNIKLDAGNSIQK